MFSSAGEDGGGKGPWGKERNSRTGPAGFHTLLNPRGRCPVAVLVPLPPGVAAGRRPATGTGRGRARSSRFLPVGRPALPDGRNGSEGACRAGRDGGRRTR